MAHDEPLLGPVKLVRRSGIDIPAWHGNVNSEGQHQSGPEGTENPMIKPALSPHQITRRKFASDLQIGDVIALPMRRPHSTASAAETHQFTVLLETITEIVSNPMGGDVAEFKAAYQFGPDPDNGGEDYSIKLPRFEMITVVGRVS